MIAKRQTVGKIGFSTTRYATLKIDQLAIRGSSEKVPSLAVASSGQTVILSRGAGAMDIVGGWALDICPPSCPGPIFGICCELALIIANICSQRLKRGPREDSSSPTELLSIPIQP